MFDNLIRWYNELVEAQYANSGWKYYPDHVQGLAMRFAPEWQRLLPEIRSLLDIDPKQDDDSVSQRKVFLMPMLIAKVQG